MATQAFSSGDFYSMGKTLGEGAYGKVKLAVHRLSGEKVLPSPPNIFPSPQRDSQPACQPCEDQAG